MKEPLPFFENNITGSLNLMQAMVETGCKKLIFSSTCATYGTPQKIPMDESLPQHPESVYGESKLVCEKIFQWAEQIHGIECVFCATLTPAVPPKPMVKPIFLRAISSRLSCKSPKTNVKRSTSSGMIMKRKMEPVCATIFILKTSHRRTFSPSSQASAVHIT